MTNNDKYKDIYSSIMLDSLENDYQELSKYQKVLKMIMDNVFMYDELETKHYSKEYNYKKSSEYLEELIKALKLIPDNQLDLIDKYFLRTIDYGSAPHNFSSISKLICLTNPKYMEENRLKDYIKYSYFPLCNIYSISLVCEVNIKYNNISNFMKKMREYINFYEWHYGLIVQLTLIYAYAHQDELDKVFDFIDNYYHNSDYYKEKISLNIDLLEKDSLFKNNDYKKSIMGYKLIGKLINNTYGEKKHLIK